MPKTHITEGTMVHLMIVAFALWLLLWLIAFKVYKRGQIDEFNSIELIDNTNSAYINYKNTSQ
jgi:hypothetical protein